jgi:hypothetical protein
MLVKPGTLLSIARAELASAFVQSGCDYWLSLGQVRRDVCTTSSCYRPNEEIGIFILRAAATRRSS